MDEARNRVVVVTGGTRGIGLEVVRQLGAAGFTAVACSRSQDSVDRASALVPGAEFVRCDVSKPAEVAEMFAAVRRRWGAPDVLVNNAGVLRIAPFEGVSEDDAMSMLRTNLLGAVWCTQAVLGDMRQRNAGLVVSVLSSSACGGRPEQAAYVASKAALSGALDCLQLELARDGANGVAVVKVVPRRTLTDMRLANFPGDPRDACLSPADVARVVLAAIRAYFDAGPAAGRMSGTTYHVA